MAFAIDLFSAQALASGGEYLDFTWAEAEIPAQTPKIDAENKKRKATARSRRLAVAQTFSAALYSGEVRSAYSTIGGGALTDIEPAWWRTDDALLRYRTFSIDPAEPFSERIDLPCWIWIEAESLKRAADRLKRERMGWGPLIPPPTLPRSETYLREDGTQETWHWDASGAVTITAAQTAQHQPKAGRPSKTTRILRVFGDHVRAGTVAERCSWEGEAIRREYGVDKPPEATTCADRIRKYYNMIRRDAAGSIVNGAAVLEAMGYPLNPDLSPATTIMTG